MNKIGALISPILKGLGLEEAIRFEEIRREWPNLFREPLSNHMSPSVLKKGDLLITVDSPVWLQQLNFLKTEILRNLRPFNVKDVRFRLGRVMPARREVRIYKKVGTEKHALKRDELQQIEDTVSEIDDGALKEGIKKAMEKSFVHGQETEKGRYGE